jgi:diadenosine tetraphosphatase ApaH/serine/threonine PP2A family protein phosphatase
MKPVAIISDIHANLEAFEAVLQDIEELGLQEIYCLGDVIGYGPNPRECLKFSQQRAKFTLRGNHEDALLFLAADFNPEAANVIDWTRAQINDKRHPKSDNHALWNFLGDLPEKRQIADILYVHASPRKPTKEYIRPTDVQDHEKMTEVFELIPRLCFCGHTHEPGVFTIDFRFFPPRAFNNRFKLPSDRKFLINIGSVGQPRDRDPRSCYVMFDGEVVEFRRVEYDVQKTMRKIIESKAIPRRFAERLEFGK